MVIFTWSKRVTLSALVQSATPPASLKVFGGAEQHLAVIGDGDPLAFGAKAETVPFVGSHLQIGPSQLFAATVDDAIEADVILERVGARHIIVVGICEPHRDAAGLIDLAANGLEAEFDVGIGGGEAVVDGEGKR